MRTQEDLESYLMSSSYLCEVLSEGTWLVRDPSQPQDRIVVRVEGELVVLRLKVLELSAVVRREGLFEQLLRFNSSEMVYGAYALSGDHIVLTSAHRLATLDDEELRASVDDFVLAVQNHHGALRAFCAGGGQS